MPRSIGGLGKGTRNAVLCITIDTISAYLSHEGGDCVRPWLFWIARPLIPHHHRKQDANSAPVKIGDHLAHAGDSARHAPNHIVLVAIVDSHVGIGRPD